MQQVGDFAKHAIISRADHLSPFSSVETRYDDKRGLAEGRRLGCTATLQGDVVIDVPEESQVHRQVVRKRAEVRAIKMVPVTHLHYIEVVEPDMHKPQGDLERVIEALREQWDLSDISCDLKVIQKLQTALRKGKWKITVAVHSGNRIIAVWPGFQEHAYGLAVDVGSTTIAAHLCDLASGEVVASSGLMNPQIRFGEDLMSRVSYVMMNPGGEDEMRDAVRNAINTLIGEVVTEADIAREQVLELVFVGNPVMHHLLLGIDPTELGGAPFALATGSGMTLWASELDLEAHENARVYILPCIAGHVGADAAGVVLSETPYLNDEITLIVDVGTNAEIILGNKDRLLAASSPTGPAFEGAQITCGQRAAPGAIERVRIDKETLEPRFQVIGCELWSDDEGFAEAVKDIGITGLCGSGIIEVLAEMVLAGLITHDGVVDGECTARTSRIQASGRTFDYVLWEGDQTIVITQNDVRAIQLAKGALYAGARLLMDHLGVDTVDRITLAGAFGSHIDTKYAMVLGMIPDCDLSKVGSAGNAAGTGARIALLNGDARIEIERVVHSIEKIETAVEPRFQDHFVGAMAFPHASDQFPNLETVVKFPPRKIGAQSPSADGSRRRRRRQA